MCLAEGEWRGDVKKRGKLFHATEDKAMVVCRSWCSGLIQWTVEARALQSTAEDCLLLAHAVGAAVVDSDACMSPPCTRPLPPLAAASATYGPIAWLWPPQRKRRGGPAVVEQGVRGSS